MIRGPFGSVAFFLVDCSMDAMLHITVVCFCLGSV